jgi:hypothetical protein
MRQVEVEGGRRGLLCCLNNHKDTTKTSRYQERQAFVAQISVVLQHKPSYESWLQDHARVA